MDSNEHIAALLLKQLSGTLTDDERVQLEAWMALSAENNLLVDEVHDEAALAEDIRLLHAENWKDRAARMRMTIDKGRREDLVRAKVRRMRRVWAAAAVLLLIAVYFLKPAKLMTVKDTYAENIAPGRNGAILILGDGKEVLLDSLGNGAVATQSGTQLIMQDGQLVYRSGTQQGEAAYNTIKTPKGRQFQVTLPDGSRVWLNAASSIRYPVFFTEKERRVEITGEVYLEVAVNASQPFIAYAGNRDTIRVLGTSFNISAYENEAAVYTTLIEGSVKAGNIILKPGQQVQVSQQVKVVQADVAKVLAWKNGLFNFEGVTLREMLRQLERWYDIEVIYRGKVPDIQFFGKMSRNIKLSDLLKGLEGSGIHYRMENNRQLVILP